MTKMFKKDKKELIDFIEDELQKYKLGKIKSMTRYEDIANRFGVSSQTIRSYVPKELKKDICEAAISSENSSTKVLFKSKDGDIPFSSFLRQERKKKDISWIEMSKICGIKKVGAYAMKTSEGKPNNPPYDKFIKIVGSLGYTPEDFKFDRSSLKQFYYGMKKERDEELTRIGDFIVKSNEHRAKRKIKLSCASIRKIAGEEFYSRFGKTRSRRKELLNRLHELDPKYANIELQNQKQAKHDYTHLTKEEARVLERAVCEYIRDKSTRPMPRGITRYVMTELNKLPLSERSVKNRSRISLYEHICKIVGKEKDYTLVRGSPNSKKSIQDALCDGIEKAEKGLSKLEREILIYGTEEEKGEKRDTYLKISSYDHQALLLYLMDPQNYKNIFNNSTELINVNFNIEGSPQGIIKKYEELVEGLKKNDDLAIIDNWLRVNMIFRIKDGLYTVAEVKQSAVDSEKYSNAQKARQQVAGYAAIISDNIRKRKWGESQSNLNESVDGVLIAYEMQEDLMNFLNASPNRSAIVIPKADVKVYLSKNGYNT